jgi:hypothetical protein
MDVAVAGPGVSTPQPSQLTFEDGLGERRYILGALNEPIEVLRLSSVLSAVSSFDFALRERAARLAGFRYESYARVRAIELDKRTSTLVVLSDYVPGIRVSAMLADVERRALPFDINVARTLIRQLVTASVAWHHAVGDIIHGALGPERLIVTPAGRLVVAEYVLGAALEQLAYSRARYWRELRIPLPEGAGAPEFDARADVAQIGAVALALVLGRPLTTDEFPDRLRELISGAALRTVTGALEPLPVASREWLTRALQLDPRASFKSVMEARASLDDAFGDENPVAELGALQVFLARQAGQTISGDVDLSPQLEAMKAFLARYPSRRQSKPAPVPPADSQPSAPSLGGAPALGGAPVSTAAPTVVRPTTAPSVVGAPAVPAAPALSSAPAVVSTPAPRISEPAPPHASEETSAIEPSLMEQALDQLEEEESPAVHQSKHHVDVMAPAYVEAPLPPHAEERRSAIPVVAWRARLRLIAVAAAIGLLVILAGFGLYRWRSTPQVLSGVLTVNTTPPGVSIAIDGQTRGVTPITLELPPGEHVVELRTETERRRIPITLTAGAQMSQFLEFPRTAGSGSASGELLVRTEPPAASVTVDGVPVGRSPLSVPDLTPGTHTVVLQHEAGSLTERVLIENGRTASLVVSLGSTPKTAAGWIAIDAPADVQVFENQRFLGNNRMDRIMLPVGRHELEIVNEDLGYRERRTVQVGPGQVASLRLEWPKGSMAINAIPWAEAWVDGTRVGETPIGNIQVPIGRHEVVFRHPELGERRTLVTVTTGDPVRVGVDLRAK